MNEPKSILVGTERTKREQAYDKNSDSEIRIIALQSRRARQNFPGTIGAGPSAGAWKSPPEGSTETSTIACIAVGEGSTVFAFANRPICEIKGGGRDEE
jgi:hypothetical protein